MCWMCDDPTMTKADALARMMKLADQYGWAIQYVEGDRVHPSFAYTVGLVRRGFPELVVSGFGQEAAGDLLNDVAHGILDHDQRCEPGQRFPLAKGVDIEVVELAHPDVHLLTVTSLLPDHPLRAYQLVWCDDRGRWPWDVGFRSRRPGQRVFGPRPTDRSTGETSASC